MYIYVVGSSYFRWYKIGISSTPEQRIISLQNNVPFKFSLVSIWRCDATSDRGVEAEAHKHFKRKREFGEWFKVSDFREIEQFIDQRATRVESSSILGKINKIRVKILKQQSITKSEERDGVAYRGRLLNEAIYNN